MTALLKTPAFAPEQTSCVANLFDGDETALFSSGSVAEMSTNIMDGEVTGAFSSGSSPACSTDGLAGEGTHLFSSGS